MNFTSVLSDAATALKATKIGRSKMTNIQQLVGAVLVNAVYVPFGRFELL